MKNTEGVPYGRGLAAPESGVPFFLRLLLATANIVTYFSITCPYFSRTCPYLRWRRILCGNGEGEMKKMDKLFGGNEKLLYICERITECLMNLKRTDRN